jgi:hypothetical protein
MLAAISESIAGDGRVADTELKNRRKCALLYRARRRPDRQLKLTMLPRLTPIRDPIGDGDQSHGPDAGDPCPSGDCLVGLTFDEYAILDARSRFPKCAIRSSAHC